MIRIAVINRSSTPASEVSLWLNAIQRQIIEHFEPAYGYSAGLSLTTLKEARPGDWKLFLIDNPKEGEDQALGYHDQDSKGKPISYVFTEFSREAGLEPSTVLSHEILETLGNPFCDQAALGPSGERLVVAYEACDATEADYYRIGDVWVSNFVFPNYFGLTDPGPYDQMKVVKRPFQIRTGGYEIFAGADRVWQASDIKAADKHARSRTQRYLNRRPDQA